MTTLRISQAARGACIRFARSLATGVSGCALRQRQFVLRQTGFLRCAGFGVVLLFALPAITRAVDEKAPASSTTKTDFEETWQAVYIGGSRVGYVRSTTERKSQEGRDLIFTDSEMSIAITRFGQAVKTKARTRAEETPEGDLLRFDFELLNPPASATRSAGRVDDKQLVIDSEVGGKKSQNRIDWDGSLKAPGYQDRLLRENPLKPGEKRTLRTFDPQIGKESVVTLQARGEEEVALLDGKKRKLLRVSIASSATPGIPLDEWLDAGGEALVTRSLLGMAIYKVSKEEALKALSGEEVDLAIGTLVKTAKIDRARETRRVVYRLTIPGEDPARVIVSGSTQKIEPLGPGIIDLTVTAISPPAAPSTDAQPAGKEFLEPNTYLQSDDARVRNCADKAVGSETDPWKAACLMERWVHTNLKEKNFSTLLASAAEVARDLQGDCTEHAVLLAAMARAKKIPSRVAVGLVYVDRLSSFGGHMWTEVFINGVWVPLDATLGEAGIAAEHIKFADSSFSETGAVAPLSAFVPLVGVLGKLQIDVREAGYKDR